MRFFSLLILAVMFCVVAVAHSGMLFPRYYTVLGEEGIQELTVDHAMKLLGRVLYASPVGGEVICISQTREASITADQGFDKLVITLESVDATGLRTNLGTCAYGVEGSWNEPGFFDGPRAVAVDDDRTCPGTVHQWRVYVADTENGRVAVLELNYHEIEDSLSLAHVGFWGSGRLQKPYDLDYDENRDFLYVVDHATSELLTFNQNGTMVDFYGGEGSGVGCFRQPMAVTCDVYRDSNYIFVGDAGNCRIVRLLNRPGEMPDILWLNEYSEPFLYPMSVTASGGTGLYALVASTEGEGVISLDLRLTQKLGAFGFDPLDGHHFYTPKYIKMRNGEIGITDCYGSSTGLSYWVLDAQVMDASATPDPFDPLQSYCLITYALTAHADLTIEVYDSNWILVDTVVDDVLTACGYHQELWDGSGQLPGLYHILFTCEDYGGDGTPDRDTLDVTIGGIPLEILDLFPPDMLVATPAWSNAGDRVAFAVTGSPYLPYDGIYVLDLDDLTWLQLTQPMGSVYDSRPDWSPSDEFLVFQRTPGPGSLANRLGAQSNDADSLAENPMDLRTSWIYKISSSGPLGSETLMAGDCYWYPVWSPYLTNEGGQVPEDGGRIAAWMYDDHQLWTFKAMDGTDHRMVTSGMDSIGGDPLLDKAMSSWSPGGREIGFNTFPGELALWTIDVETGVYSLVLREQATADLRGLRWSPGGNPIAYEIYDLDDLVTGVRTISVEGDYEQTYVVNHDWGEGFDWSPDGTKIVFVKSDLDGRSLAVVDCKRDESAIPAANIAWPVSGQILPRAEYLYIVGTAYDNVGVDDQILAPYQSHILEWGRGRDPLVWKTDYLYTLSKKEYGNIGYWDTFSNPDFFEEGVEYTLRLTVTDGVHTNVQKVYVTICDSSSANVLDRDVPLEFEISAPSPNPTAAGVVVRLGAPAETSIRVSVYSCEGRLVKEILNAGLPAGYHSIEWDGRDARGKPCASGVYWCIVDTEAFSKSMKIVLLR